MISPHGSRPPSANADSTTSRTRESVLAVELEKSVAMFFNEEVLGLRAALVSQRGDHPVLDFWIEEISSRLAHPVRRIFNVLNVDLQTLRESRGAAEQLLEGVSRETLEARLADRGSAATDFEKSAPRFLSLQKEAIEQARTREREGERLAQRTDAFLAHLCMAIREREQPQARNAPRIKPGFFVSQEYHRLKLYRAALPTQEEQSTESVAALLGGDLVWVLRRYADAQLVKSTMLRSATSWADPTSKRWMKEEGVIVDYPAPLGPEHVSFSKLCERDLPGHVSSAQLMALSEVVERYFLRRAQRVLEVK